MFDPHWLLPYESLNSEYSCACALACKLLLILDCNWAIAELVADEEDTTVVRPLPIGPALGTPLVLLLLLGTIESRCEDGEEDAAWSSGDGVMLARAGGCPMGVIERPEPVPTGAIGALLIDGIGAESVMVGPGPLAAI